MADTTEAPKTEETKAAETPKTPAPTYNYWIGSKHSDEGTALNFVMKHVVANPGVSHETLKQAVIAGYSRKTGAPVTPVYVQSLIRYAVKNGNLVERAEAAGPGLPTKPVKESAPGTTTASGETKPAEPVASESGQEVLKALEGKTGPFTRDEIATHTGKKVVAITRTLMKLVKDGFLIETKEGEVTKYSVAPSKTGAPATTEGTAATEAISPPETTGVVTDGTETAGTDASE